MDDLAALKLQIEWGADEALSDTPIDRLAAVTPPKTPVLPPRKPAPPLLPVAARAQAAAAAAASLDGLRAALAAFADCPLSTTATSLVFADGNPLAGLMLVGDAPGNEEDRAGTPFVGPPGQLLDRMLASIGLDRSLCYITNLIPWRPPGNRAPTDSEIQTCLPFLHRHIALARPRRLLLLGSLTAKTLTASNAAIRRLRGRWTDLAVSGLDGPVPTLCSFHPLNLLQTPANKRDAWADLRLLRHALDADADFKGKSA